MDGWEFIPKFIPKFILKLSTFKKKILSSSHTIHVLNQNPTFFCNSPKYLATCTVKVRTV